MTNPNETILLAIAQLRLFCQNHDCCDCPLFSEERCGCLLSGRTGESIAPTDYDLNEIVENIARRSNE